MCLWSDKEAQKGLDVLERYSQKLWVEAHDCGKVSGGALRVKTDIAYGKGQ